MSFKTRDGKTHLSHVLFGENGLPVDSIATVSGSLIFLDGLLPLDSYSAGTVTLPAGSDLTPVTIAKARYTGKYILLTKDHKIYYIDRLSIDISNRSFLISTSDKSQQAPADIDLSAGWTIAEADIVNRLATTSAAKIDSIEFRDMHFQMQLDGDPVTLLNQDGVGINPATEEKQDDQINQLQSIDNKLINDYGIWAAALRTASQIGNSTGQADFNLGATSAQTLRTSSNITATAPDGSTVNVQASGIDVGNSTSTVLSAGGIFTGAWKDVEQYASISLMVNSNVAGSITIQYSTDGINLHRVLSGPYNADPNGLYLVLPPETKFYRLIYTNGAVPQGSFSLQSILTMSAVGQSAVPINFPIVDSNSIPIYRSVITGKSTDGSYLNQRADGVSSSNSTSIPLGSGATFNGVFEDVLGYANITISVISNQTSSVDGFKIEYSSDGVNVDSSEVYTILGGAGRQYSSGVLARYARVRYINGSSAQTTFRLQTLYHIATPKPSSHRIDDNINGQNDAELSKAVITGKNPDGVFVNEGASGVVSSNTTTAPLGVGGVFQGVYFDTSEFSAVMVSCLTDQSGTILLETSDDGISVIRTSISSVIANAPFHISQTSTGKYIRVRFTNTSGLVQSVFRLQTMMKNTTVSPTALSISSPLNANSIALNSRSVLAGQQENGVFNNVGLSNTASVKVAITDRPSEVRNRIKVEARIFATSITAIPTILHTVPVGKTLYVESMIISSLNNANTIGEWRITDGAVDKLGYLIGEKATGAAATSSASSPSLPEPIPFTTNFGVKEITGDIILSIYFIGYEE